MTDLDDGINRTSFLAETAVDTLFIQNATGKYIRSVSFLLDLDREQTSKLTLVISISYRVVFLLPSSRASDSMVMACAGQMASQSLQATSKTQKNNAECISPAAFHLPVDSMDNDNEGGRRTDTSLFTVRVPSEGVFSSESGRDGTLFEGIHDGVRRSCNRRGQLVVSFASSFRTRGSLTRG
jgi:hypothetical protein